MVMHARKVPRLDDGYRDLNQQEILSKDKGSMNSHSNKYGDRKSTKFDNFDHKRHSNSPRSFNSRSAHLDNKQRDKRNYEESDPINRDTKIKEQKHKDHKSEDGFVSVFQVHKLAERVCGDWSEHISKSGKRYFYNCRTEVSQWDKPDSWTEENSTSVRNNDRVQHDASDRSKSSSSSKANSHFGESKHTTTTAANNNKTFSSASASKPSSRRDGRDSRTNFREEQRSPSKNAPSVLPREAAQGSASLRDRTSRQDRKRPYPRRSGSRSPSYGQKSGKFGSRGSSSEAGSGGCYRNSSAKNDVAAAVGNGGVEKKKDNGPTERVECSSADNKEPDNSRKSSPVHEDMDISPDNSFSQTEIETRTSHDGLNSKASPHHPSSSVPAPSSSGIANFNNNNNNNGETPSSEQPSSHAAVQIAPSSSNQESFHSTNPGNATASSWSGPSGPNSLHHHHQQQQHPQPQQSLQTTLAGLQQAVLRLIPDKMSASVPGKQGNFANCVAMLSFLLTQLSNQQQSGSHSNNSDNQLIIQQAIPLLKKLQEIVVHQQQQQQQRMLQQALFQLLQMQNPAGSNVHAGANQKSHGNVEKAESPYSPPDSDGSPVQTQSHNRHHYPHQHHSRQSAMGNRQSPRHLHQDSAHQVPVSKQARQEKMALHTSSLEDVDERTDGTSFNAGLHPKAEKNDARPSANSQLSSSSSQAPSHHPSIPFYRRHNVELTPSLVNHFNPNVIDHVTDWQADALVKQAECIAADNYTYLAPLCSQVSVELKQARSMVRVQEILSTRHEQRRIFIQHQLYELDRGLPVPSLLLPNPLATFGQQQQQQQPAPQAPPQQQHAPQAQQQQQPAPQAPPQQQQHAPQAQQHATPASTHPPPMPAIQSTPTPMSPQVSSAAPQITNLSSPTPLHDVHPATSFPSTSAATVASCENASDDMT